MNTSSASHVLAELVPSSPLVEAGDLTAVVPNKNTVLTLSTCYPFRYIGNAPKRYIVSANLIPQAPAS